MGIRVLHVLEDFSLSNTGVTSVVRQVSGWQAKHCEWVGVYVSGSVNLPPPEGVTVIETGIAAWSGSWRYPDGGIKKLVETIKAYNINLVHIHGLWRASTLVAVWAASRARVPAILSVHGQTSHWALNAQGILKNTKKKIYQAVVVRNWLEKVTLLHAITPLEERDMANFFGKKRSVVVPNAIHSAHVSGAIVEPKKYFLFLGRIHPVKGVENLIRAFMAAKIETEWQLVIAGPEENIKYAQNLKAISKDSGQIRFVGPIYGSKKKRLLECAWALIVPSYTEVMGMVNLEAGVLLTPSITTHETGLIDWELGGGVLVSNKPHELTVALEDAVNWSLDERVQRGLRSKVHVDKNYELDIVGHQWVSVYEKEISKIAIEYEFTL